MWIYKSMLKNKKKAVNFTNFKKGKKNCLFKIVYIYIFKMLCCAWLLSPV